MATSEFLQRPTTNAPGLADTSGVRRSTHTDSRNGKLATALWMMTDGLTVLVALTLSIRLVIGSGPLSGAKLLYGRTSAVLPARLDRPLLLVVGYLVWFIVALIVISKRYHLYGNIRISGAFHEQRLTIQACCTAGLLLTGILYLLHGEAISRTLVLVTIALTTVMICTRRLLWRTMQYRRFELGLDTRNIVIVGTGRVGQALRHHVESILHLGYTFKGYIHVPGVDLDIPTMGGDVMGNVDQLFDLVRKHFVDEIFVASPCERGLVKRIVEQARKAGVDVRVVPDLYDGLAWNSPVEYLGQFPTIPLHRGEVQEISLFLKRALDIVASATALVLLSPVMLLLMIMVKLDSPGPIFYESERIGKKGRVFKCIKFRTMVRDAERRRADILHMNEREGILFKISNDPRITRLGRTLRKYSLDELPQFFNVLRGDMSMVGPRPPIASEVKQYELSHLRRLDVLPGITGLWQVQARQDPSFDSYISLDTAYVENWSIWLDMKILIRTLAVVAGGTGS